MDAVLNFTIVFMFGMIAGMITMIAVDAYHERMDEDEDY